MIAGVSDAFGEASFEDDFTAFESLSQVEDGYKIIKFRDGNKTATGSVELVADGLALTASAAEAGEETNAFSVTRLRRTEPIQLGDGDNFEVGLSIQQLEVVHFGNNPVAPLSFGLESSSNDEVLRVQLGVTQKDDPTGTLHVFIERRPGGVIVNRRIESYGSLSGKSCVLRVHGGTVDLLVGGQSVLETPLGREEVFGDTDLGRGQTYVMFQAHKAFGPEARTAVLKSLSVTTSSAEPAEPQ